MSKEQIEEVKASGEDSETMDPVATGSTKRGADKDGKTKMSKDEVGEKKPSDGVNKEGGDQIETVATTKDGGRRADKKSMKEHVDSLFDGEELSEEFMDNAAAIFEAAVVERVAEEKERLQEEQETAITEAVEAAKLELEEQVDKYLDYVVEQWMKENELAIEKGMRADIAESFMSGLKTLFDEHYVDLPEDKVDIAEQLADRVAELEGELNTSINENLELRESAEKATKKDIIEEITEGLADTQKEKLTSLAEELEFSDAESFRKKLSTIKESYVTSNESKTEESLNEEYNGDDGEKKTVTLTPEMSRYVEAARKHSKATF